VNPRTLSVDAPFEFHTIEQKILTVHLRAGTLATVTSANARNETIASEVTFIVYRGLIEQELTSSKRSEYKL
jgi:hypothetical protein